MTPRVVLVGLPGAGKSTTGRRLAALLGVPFADSDELVQARTGRTVAALFAADGEPEFRRHEAAAVTEALREFDGVLALGGGAVLSAETRGAVIASGVPVVLLRARLETLIARVGDGRTRPLLAGDAERRLAELAAEREPLYREVAGVVVDTEQRSARRVAEVVSGLVGTTARIP